MNQEKIIYTTLEQLKKAKIASRKLAITSNEDKNIALDLIANELINSKESIIAANEKDIEAGKKNNLSNALLDRLLINNKRLSGMAESIKKVILQSDPIGNILKSWKHSNGMSIEKISVSLGVICVIYEARPNVTTDSIALAIKSGNSLVLRGSQNAAFTNEEIIRIVKRALSQSPVNSECLQFINKKEREETIKILEAEDFVDLIIPRGGEELKQFILKHSKIPVIGAGGGTCHLFIDESADEEMAINIAINAKTQRPGVCNAIETILIHKTIAKHILPKLKASLVDEQNVEMFACDKTLNILKDLNLATEEDWHKEYLDLKVAVKIVDSIEEAIEHINKYGTKHSESIVTTNEHNSKLFQEGIDAACIYVNVSTRFTDGEEFGFGAEVGISTQKLHARGPIGLEQLTTYKYLITGNGQIRT